MIRWRCPECENPVRMVRSRMMGTEEGVCYQQCTEPSCGWCSQARNLIKKTFAHSRLSAAEVIEIRERNRRERVAGLVEWKCPVCETRARIRTSTQDLKDYRETYMECMEPRCGWTGKGEFEVLKTLSPSARPNPKYQRRMSEHMPVIYRQADLFREEPRP
ncbi:ogr/Delta-like zinc finger family protein [Kushneria phyllosphaerae]|uniref:Zinc finger Ogr/Delta-type domain-containing protein n=1 Tax=Kushneria phyllosphaerae TaxID=2100822 RepID=A0A2R8CKN2_9GAMM|nr:ogr/Delta-like zinc finger family protein [Kushneria phyllosphaerae]SPJ33460.1 hypothetical protein KSP9073_01469 [Kushneria phyllosphaerae]